MKKAILTSFAFLSLALVVFASPAKAQTRNKEIQFSAGAGAAFNPVRFDLDLAGQYFLNDIHSLGLDIDILAGTGPTTYNFIVFGRHHFELAQHQKFMPYVGAGLGVRADTRGRGWFDLMLPQAGFLYELTPHFYFGPDASLHILGGSTGTWDFQLVGQLAYRF